MKTLRLIATSVGVTAGLLLASLDADAQTPLPPTAPEAAGFSRAGLDAIDVFFAREIAAKRIPGAVMAIARDGKLVHFQSYGALGPDGPPMPRDAVFGLASMTKIMTSVVGLSLAQEGRLPLKSPLATHLPQFGQMKVGLPGAEGKITLVDPKRPIFIHDLYRHTSGLTYGGRGSNPLAVLWPATNDVIYGPTGQEFMDRITRLPLTKQPGTEFEYSFSTDVLGLVIEKVTGKTLGEVMRERLWSPLAMKSTSFKHADLDKTKFARPLSINPLDGKPQSIPITQKQTSFDCGGACALGTVGDYLRFGQMLMNEGELEGVRILSPQTVRWMTANHLGPEIKNNVGDVEPHREGYGFGLGVAVRMSAGLAAVPGNVGEYSWNGAFGTAFFADPAERLVVVYGTAAPGEIRKYYREQLQLLVYGAMTK